MYLCQKFSEMEFTVAQIAQLLDAEVVGNPEAIIRTVCKIEEGIENGLTFLANPKYTHYIYETKATAVIVNKDFVPENELHTTLIKTENSYLALAKLLDIYNQMKPSKVGISDRAYIAPTAKIGENVYIAEFVSVGDYAVIGNNTKLYPHVYVGDQGKVGNNTTMHSGVKLYAECVVGNDCIIHAGTVIGADGFGFAQQDGEYVKVPQIGNVVIEDNVEIGANTCIDRATMGSTFIRKNVKLDNLIQVAHNVELGEGTAAAAQVGFSGSTKVGKHCIFAGQVGIAGHLEIGDRVIVGAQSGVMSNITGPQIVLGSPAAPVSEEKKLIIYRKKLPELFKQVRDLEKQLKEHD